MEVDVWDGPSGEPVVYHGHTLTSRILFKEVVATLAQYAFQVGAPGWKYCEARGSEEKVAGAGTGAGARSGEGKGARGG